MYCLRVVDTKTILHEGLLEKIIAFDKKNLADAHSPQKPFDEERRRRNFAQEKVFILAFAADDTLAGYLEYGPCQEGGEIYITSMQIDRRHRQSLLISQILLQAKRDLLRRTFTKLSCSVPEENLMAASVSAKLGFTTDKKEGESQQTLSIGPEILECKLLERIEQRTKRKKKTGSTKEKTT